MAWIDVVDREKTDAELKRVYERIQGTRGRISNIFLSQSLNPGALEAHLDLYLRIMFGQGTLTRLEREMIAVTVSATNNCEYCVAHHSAAMSKYLPDGEFIKLFAKDFESVNLEPKVKAMLRYASKLTTVPSAVSAGDIAELRRVGFADPEILHIAMITSYFNFVNRLASGLGVSIEEDGGSGYKY